MDGLEFVSSLVSSLAWPIVIVTGFVLFRGGLNSLLDRLADFEGFGVKARLAREVNDVREVLEDKVEETSGVEPSGGADPDGATADESPGLLEWQVAMSQFQDSIAVADGEAALGRSGSTPAVALAWRALEVLLNDVAEVLQFPDANENAPIALRVSQMKAMGLISENMVQALEKLYTIRNEAVHGPATSEIARPFVKSVSNFGAILEPAVRKRISDTRRP